MGKRNIYIIYLYVSIYIYICVYIYIYMYICKCVRVCVCVTQPLLFPSSAPLGVCIAYSCENVCGSVRIFD